MKRRWNERRARAAAFRIVAVALLLLLLGSGEVEAVRTRNFVVDSYGAYRRAKTEGVALRDDGRIFLGPEVVRLADPGVRTIWALVPWGDDFVAATTGDQGKLLSVGKSGPKPETKNLADLLDYELFAATVDLKGNLYVSGAPTGTVTCISRDGKVRSLFRVPEQAVFSLAAAPDGSVYAAVGERGRLYRITSDGEGKIVSESPDVTLRSLAWGKDGQLFAGTAGRGLVETIGPADGKAHVLYDAAEEEIVAIVPLPSGGLIFGANPGSGSGSSAAGGPPAQTPPSSPEGAPSGVPGPPDRDEHESPRPVVYLMSPSGSVRPLWKCPEKMIHALALDADGNVLVATGDDAAIYRVTMTGQETVLWEPEEEQVLSLLTSGKTIFAGTGSPGRLYRLGPGRSQEGRLTFEVQDGKDQVNWGHLRYEGWAEKGELKFETRSGFTKETDPSWNDWTAVQENEDGLLVQSPAARFLQWRVLMKPGSNDGPAIRRVAISYGGVNAQPRIGSLRISADDPTYAVDPGRGGITQTLPGGIEVDYSLNAGGSSIVAVDEVPIWIRRVRSVVWDAMDPDNDDLEFTLEIRGRGEGEWRTLAKGLRDRAYTMDNGMLPDGVYEIRLTASDAPANPPGTELTAQKLTPLFHVDTQAPTFANVKAKREEARMVAVSGSAIDESSALRRIDVSIDGGPFLWLSPKDGLLDSRIEEFSGHVPLTVEQTGNWIVVRAQDEAGNRGSYRVWLEP